VHFYSAPHSHHYTDGQLVRVQGMIQDMHNPEYYISKYTVHNKVTGAKKEVSGKYKDIMKVEVKSLFTKSDLKYTFSIYLFSHAQLYF